ncbi:hypothetical protein TUM4261_32010 [Shewanella sp. c952]|uniref:hypothetical protein n=1 Tax=Shewanella sp. c952 TaxID=2815913 RepID=UPI001BB88207|nr:hypothetical protein [Shewanella sp. c952]GIU15294.1 hypothetical protein TUM4261_32010 [Shewanella sp. c952]
MLYFIHPLDDSTKFLGDIYNRTIEAIGCDLVTVYTFENESPEDVLKIISSLPSGANIYFLGHGRADRLYGIMSESNEPFVSPEGMRIFNDKNLFTLACNSTKLLSSSFQYSRIKHSIGFGYLPTSDEEVKAIRNMKNKPVSDADLEEFKRVIVKCVSDSVIFTYKKGRGFYYLSSQIRLMLYKEMNESVLKNKNSSVANLIYQVCYQMSYFSN